MAYINLEADRADYKLVLGIHTRPSNPSQIPEDCTGILLEGNFSDRDQIGVFVDPDYTIKQYQRIVPVAKERGIPLVLAESIWKEESIPYSLAFKLSPSDIIRAWLGVLPTTYVTRFSGEIDRNSAVFRYLSWLAEPRTV